MQKHDKISVNELVEISFGVLLNRPSIEYFYGICDEPEKVQRGDLFVLNPDKIISFKKAQNNAKAGLFSAQTELAQAVAKAISNGAYGVLFSGEIGISSTEVAWVSCDDLQSALIRIVRYYLALNHSILFALNPAEYELCECIIENNENILHQDSLATLANRLRNEKSSYIFYKEPPSKNARSSIAKIAQIMGFSEFRALGNNKIAENKMPFSLISFSLFEMRIFYQSNEYEIALPQFFAQSLARVILLLQELRQKINLANEIKTHSFCPIYLDSSGFVSTPGTSNRVLLATNDRALFEQYLVYFRLYAKWARTCIFANSALAPLFTEFAPFYASDSESLLFENLLNKKYNFALIFGTEAQTIINRFAKPDEKGLFD